jgi:hypothetical protein
MSPNLDIKLGPTTEADQSHLALSVSLKFKFERGFERNRS